MQGAAPRGINARAAICVCVAAAVVAAFAYRNLLPRFGSAIGPTSADPFFTVTILEWVASRIPFGLSGVWNPPYFYPASNVLVLSDHMFLFAGIYGVFRYFGAGAASAHNFLFFLSFSLTAGATFLLLRRAVRAPGWIAGVLALAVTFAPWRWGQSTHLLMLWAYGAAARDTDLRSPSRASPRSGRFPFIGAQMVLLLSGCYLALLTLMVLPLQLAVRGLRRSDRVRWLRQWRPLPRLRSCRPLRFWRYLRHMWSREKSESRSVSPRRSTPSISRLATG